MRATLLICALTMSAGLLSAPAAARSRDREPQRQQQRIEERREEPREERRAAPRDEHRDNRREEPREGPREESPVLAPNDWRDAPATLDRSDAARRAQRRNGGGRVLSVDPEDGGYRVKVLKDGEVRTHHVDGGN